MIEDHIARQVAILCSPESDRDEVYAAGAALRGAGPAADSLLLDALADDSRRAEARSRIAGVLAERGIRGAVPLLVACLEDPSVLLRWSAATALGQLGSYDAASALERAATTDAGELTLQPGFTIRVADAARAAFVKLRPSR